MKDNYESKENGVFILTNPRLETRTGFPFTKGFKGNEIADAL